jgi:hypothetical protein
LDRPTDTFFSFSFSPPFFVEKDINNAKKNSSLKKTLVLPDTLAPGENSLLLKAGNTNLGGRLSTTDLLAPPIQ